MLFLLGVVMYGTAAAQSSAGKQRYVSLMLLNLSDRGDSERRLIQMAQEYGMNSVYLTIQWDKVYYDSPTRADWSRFDEQIKSVVDRGMSVAIRIHLARPKGRLTGFWDWEKDGLKDQYNISQMGAFTATTFRYSHESSAEKAAAFVKEVTERYKWVHDQGKLIFIATSNTPEQEAGYPYQNFEPDTDHPKIYPAIFDCSEETKASYREWLRGHYKKIERLNYVWGADFSSFDQVEPHIVHWEPRESFKQRYGKDWYMFRHEQLKTYTEKLIAAVKSVSPTIRYISDYGSVVDMGSGLRGTTAFGNLNEKADGVKVNDAPGWNHRLSTDVLRGGLPRGAFIGNEVFINNDLQASLIDKQVNECFAHGADFVCFVVSTESDMQKFQGQIRGAVANWKSKPKHEIVDTDSISFNLTRVIDHPHSMAEMIAGPYNSMVNKDPNNPRPVKLKVEDDMFVPSYWEMAANRRPYLRTPLPMQIKARGTAFSFDIHKENFGDLDGWIDSIEIINLPGWLSFDGLTVSGTGNILGDTRLEVRAIDDEGGTFSAFLTLRIDPDQNTNIPPKLQLNLSELVARINEPYQYELPPQMFADEDGSITKVEASDLPDWLSFADGKFSGTPAVRGDFRVTLKAYDNENAFVETYLTIRVVDPSFFNNAPRIENPILTQYSPENEVFRFDIPSNTFSDPDGYVSNVTLHAHPTWLSITFNRIEGLPPGKGEYSFFVRAFDNNGAFVDAPVTLRVEEASLRFTLQEGGAATDTKVFGLIRRGDVFHLDSIPSLLNIFTEGNYPFDRVAFKLTGPFAYASRTRHQPFTLYAGTGGFEPSIGRYDLYAEAYTWDDSLLYATTTFFYISNGNDLDITGDMPEWTAYPVPFSDILNVKTDSESTGTYDITVVASTGQKVEIPGRFIIRTGPLYQINFSQLGLPSGIYFVLASQNGVLRRKIKVVRI